MASSSSSLAPESQSAFEERIGDIIKTGSIIPCIAIGSKLGLFEKMAEFSEPRTSQQIADATDCKERYVREWLNSMVSIHVFDYDEEKKTYFFPEHKQDMFTAKGGPKNMSRMAEGSTLAAAQYQELQKCFKKDGPLGIPYDRYVSIHEWVEGNTQFTEEFIKSKFRQEPGLLDQLERGISVCDMGCSTGNQVRVLARMFPNSQIHGCDIGSDAIQRAIQLNEEDKLHNVTFSVQDICELPADWSEKFDLVLGFDVIHDLAYASKALLNIHRSLKAGGKFYMKDLANKTHPANKMTFLYTMSMYHCLAQSLWYENSEGLGSTWSTELAREMLQAAGFSAIKELQQDGLFMYICCDK